MLAHPVITAYVVVVTANHWWLDGGVAFGLLLVALAGLVWWRDRRAARPAVAAVTAAAAPAGPPALTGAEPSAGP